MINLDELFGKQTLMENVEIMLSEFISKINFYIKTINVHQSELFKYPFHLPVVKELRDTNQGYF